METPWATSNIYMMLVYYVDEILKKKRKEEREREGECKGVKDEEFEGKKSKSENREKTIIRKFQPA